MTYKIKHILEQRKKLLKRQEEDERIGGKLRLDPYTMYTFPTKEEKEQYNNGTL